MWEYYLTVNYFMYLIDSLLVSNYNKMMKTKMPYEMDNYG